MNIVLAHLSPDRAGQQKSLTGPVIRLGRHPSSDIVFNGAGDTSVSTHHAEIRREGSGWVLHDVGSTNGTFVDGRRVSGPTPLRDGSVIQLAEGGPQLRVSLAAEQWDSPSPAQTMRAAPPQLVVEHVSGSRAGSTQMFTEPVIRIGRADECEVRFDAKLDARASGRHAELRREGNRYMLYDTGSSNGTFVNGQRVQQKELAPNDVVEFGEGGPRLRFTLQPNTAVMKTAGTAVTAPGGRSVAAPAGPGQNTVMMWVRDAVQKSRNDEPSTRMREYVQGEARTQAKRTSRVYAVAVGMFALVLSGGVLTKSTLDNRALRADMVQHVNGVQEALRGQLATTQKAITALEGQGVEVQGALEAHRARAAELQRQLNSTQEQLGAVDAKTAQALRSFKQVAAAAGPAVYMLAIDYPDLGMSEGFCSGFAVRAEGLIATNGHCVDGFLESLEAARDEGLDAIPIVIRNSDPDIIYRVTQVDFHPLYVSGDISSVDIGLAQVDTRGDQLPTVTIASDADIADLSTGEEVAVYGFPGELMDTSEPIATLFPGTIGRIDGGGVIQHTSLTSGGTSGSPLLNKSGHVVGVNYAGGLERDAVMSPIVDRNGAIVYDEFGQPVMRPIRMARRGISYAIHGKHLVEWLSTLK